jgi:hypothetical protein
MDEAVEYLNQNVKGITGEMLRDLLNECPDRPKAFMFKWLSKRLNLTVIPCQDRIELEQLRTEEKLLDNSSQTKTILKSNENGSLKKIPSKNISEKSVVIQTQINEIKTNSNKHFKRTMTPAIKGSLFKSNLKQKNDNLHYPSENKESIAEDLEECENDEDNNEENEDNNEEYNNENNNNEGNNENNNNEEEEDNNDKEEDIKSKKSETEEEEEEDEDEDEEKDMVEELIQSRIKAVANRGQRSSVSAEVYGFFNKKAEYVPKFIPKTKEQKERIHKKIIQSFLFNSLEEHDLNTVIDAMEERRYQENDYIIRQGENGSVLYLVESGQLDCYKKFVN